mmetsp:Transcript_25524/g.64767  ORF Transcript_25524/g.64767 Transcript_25524/m.64767 type:complete len:115 (-) Transcript_25524:124-468(-)
MMSQQKINFREQKTSNVGKPATRSASRKAAEALQPSQGVSGEEAVTNFDIDAEERLLRAFDLATKYGPCAGMTRLERWERAEKFGLSPPAEVREVVLRRGPGSTSNQPVWAGRI